MIERVAGLKHRGCVGTALDQGPMLRLQDYLQNGFPIQNLTMMLFRSCYYAGIRGVARAFLWGDGFFFNYVLFSTIICI